MGVNLVKYEVNNGIATITLDDPPVNGYTYEMNRQVDEKIVEARFDTDVHVIVITGEGDKFFCAGANIKMLASVDPTFKYYFCLHANETLSRLEQTPKLTIAALNGHCVGGGLEYAMACDIRIARKDAGMTGLPEVTLGVLPGTGGTQRLSRLVGKSKAIELMVEGRNFDFEEGKEMGIINYVYDSESHEALHEAGVRVRRSSSCRPTRRAWRSATSSAPARPAPRSRSSTASPSSASCRPSCFQLRRRQDRPQRLRLQADARVPGQLIAN